MKQEIIEVRSECMDKEEAFAQLRKDYDGLKTKESQSREKMGKYKRSADRRQKEISQLNATISDYVKKE